MSGWMYLGVAACGAFGAFARFAVDFAVQRRRTLRFPVGTLVVNLVGSSLLGLLVGPEALGSFTTFSTWMIETERLAEDGLDRAAALNIFGGAALGLLTAAAGWAVGAVA